MQQLIDPKRYSGHKAGTTANKPKING